MTDLRVLEGDVTGVADGDLFTYDASLGYLVPINPAMIGLAVGDIKMTFDGVAQAGFLILNGDTIGSAASIATQAGAEYEDLFIHLWDKLANAEAPVSGGRGASGAADFAANKTLTMPDARQRIPIHVGATASVDAPGKTTGSFDHTHSVAAHYHGMGAGADLNITSSGTHTTSIDHDHGSFTSGAGSAHTHGLGTIAISSSGTHTTAIDHDHASFTSGAGGSHVHTIDHDHGSFTSGTESSHTHSLAHDHATAGTGAGSSHSHGLPSGLLRRVAGGTFSILVAAGANDDFYNMTTDSESSHTHNLDLPNHTGNTGAGTSHSHSIDVPAITGNSGAEAAHTHSIDVPAIVANSASTGAHAHLNADFSGSLANESAHTHSIDVPALVQNSASTGAHTHASGDVAGRIGLVTGGVDGNAAMTSGANNPPVLALYFQIKY